MAVQAYVLVDCAPGKPFQIVEALRKLPAVEMAHAVTGSYDVIVFVQAASMAELGDLLSRHIHRLPGIVKTTTNVVVEKTAPRGSTERNPGRQA